MIKYLDLFNPSKYPFLYLPMAFFPLLDVPLLITDAVSITSPYYKYFSHYVKYKSVWGF